MNNQLNEIVEKSGVLKDLDLLEVSTFYFSAKTKKTETFSFSEKSKGKIKPVYFDLASVTKILTNGLINIIERNELTKELQLCLEHRAGIPSWGILSNTNWKNEVSSHQIKESPTLYSDIGALRAQLIFEELTKKSLYSEAKKFWHNEVIHGNDLSERDSVLQTGYREKNIILGQIHDPNAFNIKEKLSHAGLFSTSLGLSSTLIKIFTETNLKEKLISSKVSFPKKRFHLGWDTPSKENSLAGEKLGQSCFGHLGFTGTSVWVDLDKEVGICILSNITRDGWYNKERLNKVRNEVGTLILGNKNEP